ncbi:replicative DNA helicase [Pseudalkalibacillus caeni]|uniref:DNA 5'-3' helicase n=1 Tax=Exobacillus caeni TaxID=2574798 RepID=A0A5R9F817_9BACL|nr:DnaB-like helicase C-terminal domain-containing protein [Pseudalkalibacillus caeni]TLS37768.1 replicative DNA helicase [Pseudalkalibacillus caeni]
MNKFELATQNEAFYLGSILKDPTLLNESRLQPKHFFHQKNRELFKAMIEVKNEGEEISVVSLAMLGESQTMKFGGNAYLSEIMNGVPSVHSFQSYEKFIMDFHTVQVAQEHVNSFLENTKESHKLTELSSLIANVTKLETATVKRNESFKEKLANRMEQHYNSPKTGLSGIDTGYVGLNKYTDGFQRTDLIVVAARPSVGKTALVMNSALNGLKNNKNLFHTMFSIEMADEPVIDRLIAMEGRINLMKMRNPNKTFDPNGQEWDRYQMAIRTLEKLNVDIRRENTVPEIRSAVRRNIKEHPDKDHIVSLDFLTLVKHTNPSGNKHSDISDIIVDLKGIANEFNVPFIVISQLSRSVENRQDKRPVLSDLNESGTIEQIADVVMLLYRPDYYQNDDPETKDLVEINFAKSRQGRTGLHKMKFVKETNTFHDLVY